MTNQIVKAIFAILRFEQITRRLGEQCVFDFKKETIIIIITIWVIVVPVTPLSVFAIIVS